MWSVNVPPLDMDLLSFVGAIGAAACWTVGVTHFDDALVVARADPLDLALPDNPMRAVPMVAAMRAMAMASEHDDPAAVPVMLVAMVAAHVMRRDVDLPDVHMRRFVKA